MYTTPYEPGFLSIMKMSARDRAVNVLRGQAASWINFTFRGMSVKASDFLTVATALEKNQLYMDIDFSELYRGEYRPLNTKVNDHPVSGKFLLGSETSNLDRPGSKALLIHEAVHASLDLRSKNSITILQSECMAYIAQQLWTKAVTGEYVDTGLKFKKAAKCAKFYWDAKNPTEEAILELQASIMGDADYGWKAAWDTAAYDG